MNKWLKENLACPRDHSHIVEKNQMLLCQYGHVYHCVDDIPIMLLDDVEVTHEAIYKTLDEAKRESLLVKESSAKDASKNETSHVDPYVQQVILGTCGYLYKPLINKLTRYPIPAMRFLPEGHGRRLLDIGCNWGRWCVGAFRSGYAPVGIDPSLEAILAARRVAQQLNVSATYIVADARYLPFTPKSFDVVFSYSVLQSFAKENVRRTLAEIARVLKDSGTCLVQMANVIGVRSLYNQGRRKFKEPAPHSFEARYWSPGELERAFRVIGTPSVFVDGFFSLNPQATDLDILPIRYRLIVRLSERLRQISEKMPWMKYCADSLYVKAFREEQSSATG